MSSSLSPNLERLAVLGDKIHQKKATGKVICITRERRLTAHFGNGQLIWIKDDRHHCVRRWLRVTKGQLSAAMYQQVPQFPNPNQLWESQVLHKFVAEGSLTAKRAIAIVSRAAIETLFVLEDAEPMMCTWRPASGSAKGSQVRLTGQAFRQALENSYELQQNWSLLKMARNRAYDGLILKATHFEQSPGNSSTLLNLQALFKGDRNFWDLLHHFSDNPTAVIRILQHFIQQDILTFQTLGDRPMPTSQGNSGGSTNQTAKHTSSSHSTANPANPGAAIPAGTEDAIASHPIPQNTPQNTPQKSRGQAGVKKVLCIDDSAQDAEMLRQQFGEQGIQVIVCHNPLKAVPLAIKHRPDLILLDLVMPIVNGHETCAQLRRVKRLAGIPIVILTGQHNLGNRLRSKLVKASDFVSKPLTSGKVAHLIQRYLTQLDGQPIVSSPAPASWRSPLPPMPQQG